MKAILSIMMLAIFALFANGCAFENYKCGDEYGHIPKADTGLNLVLMGGRFSSDDGRNTIWCPLFGYDSYFGESEFRMFGPGLPNLLGYLDHEEESGFVTPIFSKHGGEIDSFSIGPMALPLFRLDRDSEYWNCRILILDFGNWGGGIDPTVPVLGNIIESIPVVNWFIGHSSLPGMEKKPLYTKFVEKDLGHHGQVWAADAWEW